MNCEIIEIIDLKKELHCHVVPFFYNKFTLMRSIRNNKI